MEPNSQDPTTDLYPVPDESSQHRHTLFSEISFNTYYSFISAFSSKWSLHSGLPTLYAFLIGSMRAAFLFHHTSLIRSS